MVTLIGCYGIINWLLR